MDSKLAIAIAASGGTTAVAKRLGESPQTLNNWIGRGVPVARCAEVEEATGGAVMRWDLQPEDWHIIWPELKRAKGAPPIPSTKPKEEAGA